MKETRMKKTGKPFASISAAKTGQARLKREENIDSKITEVLGGFGLEFEVADAPDTGAVPRRVKRVPIGTRNVLTAPPRQGYKRRFVNIDEEKEGWDRVERFQGAGYTIVEGDVEIGNKRIAQASQVGRAVIRSVGGGIKGVLMEIKDEYYDEDQQTKQDRIDATEQSMQVNENDPGDGMYGKVQIGSRG